MSHFNSCSSIESSPGTFRDLLLVLYATRSVNIPRLAEFFNIPSDQAPTAMGTSDGAPQSPRSSLSERAPPSPESITSPPPLLILPRDPNHGSEHDRYDEQDLVRPILRRGEPGSLHLTPCTLQQYEDLGHDHNDPYDLVDGLLVSVPPMEDNEHHSLAHWLSHLLSYLPVDPQRNVVCYTERTIRLNFERDSHQYEETSAPRSPDHASSSKAVHQASSSKSKSKSRAKSTEKTGHESSSSSTAEAETCRRPDFCIVDATAGSENQDTPLSPFEIKRQRSGEWKKAIMVGEVTSTNRMKDLKHRVLEYKRAKIPEYIILDRKKHLKHREPCVEVHKLDTRTSEYERKVYSKSEVVKCSFFDHWRLTADHMLDYKYLERLVQKEKMKNARKDDTISRQQKTVAQLQEKNARKDDTISRQQKTVAQLQEKNARKDDTISRQQKTVTQLQEKNTHILDYFQGRRRTPPRELILSDSLLKTKTQSERGEASQSPKSPKSPPLRVRKVENADVKTSSRRERDTHKASRNKK